MLRLVREAEKRGEPVMTPERAVHRLTGELADWLGLDAGTLAPGRRADVVVLDPERLGAELDKPRESSMEGFDDFTRLVNQNCGAVESVLINGRLAVHGGAPVPALGMERGFGRVLRVGSSPRPSMSTPNPTLGPAALAMKLTDRDLDAVVAAASASIPTSCVLGNQQGVRFFPPVDLDAPVVAANGAGDWLAVPRIRETSRVMLGRSLRRSVEPLRPAFQQPTSMCRPHCRYKRLTNSSPL